MADNLYLFYGDEEFLIKEKIAELKNSLSGQALNVEQLDGEDVDLETITSALQTQSLLFGGKLLIIKNADLSSKVWVEAAPALKNIPDGTTVVIWSEAVDKRSKTYKLLDEVGRVCEFRTFADWEQDQVIAWIMRRSKELGKEIDRPAAIRLQEICGNSLMKLAAEIDKLVTFIGSRPSVEAADVEQLASAGEISVFELTDAVADKNLRQALNIYRTLYKNKVEVFRLLSLLASQFRTMLLVKKENNPMKIAQLVGTSPYFVKKCLQKAGKFNEPELKRDLEMLLETDLKLKSGEEQLSVFELLLASLCGS
ncbi:MAG: DNA polymerase III subunit delta [Candidatus Margulisbacteria bacterium]|nr:DNA polymerase III subunit delta [Candidatus Margulisiibacteriota bacterium]